MFACVAFIVSLYGGVALLTAALFANGFLFLATISGLVLSSLTITALGLFGAAWSMTAIDPGDEIAERMAHIG